MDKGIEKRMDEQLDREGINDPRIRKLRVAHAVACDEVSRLRGTITELEKSLNRAHIIRDMLFEVLAEQEPSEPMRVTPGAMAAFREARERMDDPDYLETMKRKHADMRRKLADAMMMGSPKFDPEGVKKIPDDAVVIRARAYGKTEAMRKQKDEFYNQIEANEDL